MRRRSSLPQRAVAAALAAACICLSPAPARSQEAAPSGSGQRLVQFLAQALRRRPRLYAPLDAYDQAEIRRDVAAARFNTRVTPFFSAAAEPYGTSGPSFGVSFEKMLPTGTTVRFRGDSFGYDLGNTSYRDNGYTFWLSQPLVAAFGPEPDYELVSARRAIESAANAMRETRQRLVLEVAGAYFNIVRQQRLVAASEVAVERAERLRVASQARMDVGLATRLDVLRADLFMSQAQAGLEDRRTALADAEDQLKLLTGRSMGAHLQVAGDDLEGYTSAYELVPAAGGSLVRRRDDGPGAPPRGQTDDHAPAATLVMERNPPAPSSTLVIAAGEPALTAGINDGDDLRPFIATGRGTRIDIKEARARVNDADRAASVATWRMLPQVTLNARYTDRGLWSPATPFGDPLGGLSIGVGTAYSLDRTNERAAFASPSISVRAAERNLADLQERVTLELRRAHRAVLRAGKTIAIQTQAVDLSARQLELAQLRYERGLADNFDVVDAESNYFTAQSALVSAGVDRALAGLALDLAMGLLDPDRYLR